MLKMTRPLMIKLVCGRDWTANLLWLSGLQKGYCEAASKNWTCTEAGAGFANTAGIQSIPAISGPRSV